MLEDQVFRVFLKYHTFVQGVAFRCLPFPGLVEDVVQHVYAELLAKKDEIDFSRDMRAYLALMTKNIAHSHWRKSRKSMPVCLQKIAEHVRLVAEENSRSDQYEEKLIALQKCLDALPSKSRELIHLHYFDNLKMRQIAEQLGHKTNTVCRAIARVRDRLGECIKKRLEEEIDVFQ